MAQSMTYNSLVTTLQSYQERVDTNFIAQIPTFIMLAEWRIATDLKGLGYLQVEQGTFSIGNPLVQKPAFWKETVSFSYNNGTSVIPLFPRSYEYARTYWPQVTGTAPPRFYSDMDFNNWWITPPPDQAYNFEVLSYVRIQPLDTSTQTNWLTANAPNVLLNACMVEVQKWLKNPAMIQQWEQTYRQSLEGIEREDVRRIKDRSEIRITQE